MTTEQQEKFRLRYQAGKNALEKGEYNLSVQYLEEAKELVAKSTRLGGEAQIWLVMAYQAAGQLKEAIALCQELATHLHPEIRQQAKRVLYIIQAPQLKRPKEWMSEIPDLTATSNDQPQYVTAKNQRKNNNNQTNLSDETVDLSQVNTKDNQFIWFALVIIILTFGGLFLFK
jgi:tetratricopeptide (TPR) repeat protein